jgi:FMN reductase (NADPH)/FMN reductase [NAD(P)H]
MNQVIEVIHNRKSVRAYEDEPVPEDVRDLILKSAMRAPTAGNMMLYSIIEVSDQEAKDKLVDTCDNQPFIAKAPLVLVFLADYQRWVDSFKVSGVEQLCAEKGVPMVKPEEGDLFLACCDALIAAQTAVIAAESLGVGSCYIGDILENYEIHREMFDLPQYAIPICMVCFGYPSQEQRERERTERFGEEFIVFKNRYKRLGEEEFEEMYAGFYERLMAGSAEMRDQPSVGIRMYKRKFSAEYAVEMRRSVRAILEAWIA